MRPFRGTYTALLTPFDTAGEIDWERYATLLDGQASAKVDGVVVGGTTGESPAIRPAELDRLVRWTVDRLPSRVEIVVGVGRSSCWEVRALVERAVDQGVGSMMLVDPAYNAPSSAEIRREYLGPLLAQYPEVRFLSYVVPGRTGTRILPEDLALTRHSHPNLLGVKDATGEEAYGRRARALLPPPFSILSGDDGRAVGMIQDPRIRADGVVSVVAELSPELVVRAVRSALESRPDDAQPEIALLRRLGGWVSFTCRESTPLGPVDLKVRNPVPIKAVFALLGGSLGPCRPPLGRLPPGAFDWLAEEVRRAEQEAPRLFDEIRAGFGSPSDPAESADRIRDAWAYAEY